MELATLPSAHGRLKELIRLGAALLFGILISCGRTDARPDNQCSETLNLDDQRKMVHSPKGFRENLPIHYRVSAEFSPPLISQLKNAMATWESAVGKTLFHDDGVDSLTGDGFSELYDPLKDDVVGFYLDKNWQKNTLKPRQIYATTIWENETSDVSKMRSADVIFNSEFFKFGDTELSKGQKSISEVDFESVALHEIGHLLGLKHVVSKGECRSVMTPELNLAQGKISRTLFLRDIDLVRSIYAN